MGLDKFDLGGNSIFLLVAPMIVVYITKEHEKVNKVTNLFLY